MRGLTEVEIINKEPNRKSATKEYDERNEKHNREYKQET